MTIKLPVIEINVNSVPMRFQLKYSVCKNPDCDCNLVGIELANAERGVGFFFDFNDEAYKDQKEKYSGEELAVINSFIEFVISPQNEKYNLQFFKQYYRKVKECAKIRKQTIDSYTPGEMLSYADIFGEQRMDECHWKGKTYLLHDSYCVIPSCDCTEIGLNFFEKVHKIGSKEADFSFVYNYITRKVRDLEVIEQDEAEELASTFGSRINQKFERKRKEIVEEVGSEVLAKIPLADNKKLRKLGRNEPCHCGSGIKYKKCCLENDIKERGKPQKVWYSKKLDDDE